MDKKCNFHMQRKHGTCTAPMVIDHALAWVQTRWYKCVVVSNEHVSQNKLPFSDNQKYEGISVGDLKRTCS